MSPFLESAIGWGKRLLQGVQVAAPETVKTLTGRPILILGLIAAMVVAVMFVLRDREKTKQLDQMTKQVGFVTSAPKRESSEKKERKSMRASSVSLTVEGGSTTLKRSPDGTIELTTTGTLTLLEQTTAQMESKVEKSSSTTPVPLSGLAAVNAPVTVEPTWVSYAEYRPLSSVGGLGMGHRVFGGLYAGVRHDIPVARFDPAVFAVIRW